MYFRMRRYSYNIALGLRNGVRNSTSLLAVYNGNKIKEEDMCIVGLISVAWRYRLIIVKASISRTRLGGFQYNPFTDDNESEQIAMFTHNVPLSPSSIIWYWPNSSDALRLGRHSRAWRKVTVAYR